MALPLALAAGTAVACLLAGIRPAAAQTESFSSESPVTGRPAASDAARPDVGTFPGSGSSTGPASLEQGLDGNGARRSQGSRITGEDRLLPPGLRQGRMTPDPALADPERSPAFESVRPRSGNPAYGLNVGATTRAPTSLLRRRAAPLRRDGSATRGTVREAVQLSTTALRASPVVQAPVVGVPLPTPLANSTFGLLTPGAILGNNLRRPGPVDDAYAPLGIKLGSITVLPAFTQSVGYDNNPDQIGNRFARGSAALRSEGEINFRSDWSASEIAGELRGGYTEFPGNQDASRPNAVGAVRARFDVSRDLRFDTEGHFLVDTLRAGSPDLQLTTASRPIFATYGASVGATQSFNRLQLSVRGLVDRQDFEDARLSNGTSLSQADRNFNQYGLRLRAAYEVSPVFTPFVDMLLDTRAYDQVRDFSGLRRDSDGIAGSAGVIFALAQSLSGEVAAGYQHRSYADPLLRDIDAPLVNAALVWAASPLTTVRFSAVTGVTETTLPGSSGVLSQAGTVEVQHDLLRNLSVVLGGSFLHNSYQSSPIRETGFSALARLDYRFNRWLTFRGSYLYQQIDSSVAGSSFSSSAFLLGVRVNP